MHLRICKRVRDWDVPGFAYIVIYSCIYIYIYTYGVTVTVASHHSKGLRLTIWVVFKSEDEPLSRRPRVAHRAR